MKIMLRFCASVLLFSLLFSSADAARTPALRYRFSAGQTNVYSVQLEQRGENGLEILAGNIFVTVKPSDSNSFQLNFKGNLVPKPGRESRPMYSPGFPGRLPMSLSLNESSEIQIDARGHLLRTSNDPALPVPLGQMMRSIVEDFSGGDGKRWEISDETFVLDDPLNSGPAPAFILSPQYGSFYFGARMTTALVAVKQRVKYDVIGIANSQVTLRKQIQLESILRTGSTPRLKASGEGTFVFDAEQGLLRQLDMESQATVSTETTNRKFSTALHCRLLEGAELESALNPPPTAPPVAKKLSNEELQKIIADLKTNDTTSPSRNNAINRLNSGTPEKVSPELIEAVTAVALNSENYNRQQAATFLANYATKESVPTLLKLLKDSDSMVRQSAVRGLGRLKDPRAAGPLTDIISRGQSEAQEAANALIKIGPEAENAVLELLQEKNVETRRRACAILAQIGTQKSIEPLKSAMLDSDQTLSQAAIEAVRAIQARQ